MYFGVVWINLITLLAEISSETLVFFVLALVSGFAIPATQLTFPRIPSSMFTSVYDNLHVGFLRSSFVNAVWLKLSMWRFWSIMMEKSDFTSNLTPMYSKICCFFSETIRKVWFNPLMTCLDSIFHHRNTSILPKQSIPPTAWLFLCQTKIAWFNSQKELLILLSFP